VTRKRNQQELDHPPSLLPIWTQRL
jgi:hypothetical protein